MPTFETLARAIERVGNLQASATYQEKLTNVIGIVVDSELPRATRGPDMAANVKLLDPSLEEAGPVELIVFSPSQHEMPRPNAGDILELRHVIVQFWEPPGALKRPQLFGKMSRPHSFGFLLYHRAAPATTDTAAALQPYQVYNAASVGGEEARQRLIEMRNFAEQMFGAGRAAHDAPTPYLRRIKELGPPEQPGGRPDPVDMRVQVLAIDQRASTEEVVLYVWDATDARPLAADLVMPASKYKQVDLSISRLCRRSMPLFSQPPGLIVMPKLPPFGTAVPVIMQPDAVPPHGLPPAGQWVKLRIVGLLAVQGQLQVVFGACSRLGLTQPATGFDTWYQTRLANNDTCEWPLEDTNIATRCSRPGLPLLTARQVLLRAAEQQQGPFRVQARLTGYSPQELKQWCKRDNEAEGSSQQQQWAWAASLRLEDSTGELQALLLGEEGTKLLGLPPHNLSHPDDVRQLQERLAGLSSVDETGGVWLEVALTVAFKEATSAQQSPVQPHVQQGAHQQQPEGQQSLRQAVQPQQVDQQKQLQNLQVQPVTGIAQENVAPSPQQVQVQQEQGQQPQLPLCSHNQAEQHDQERHIIPLLPASPSPAPQSLQQHSQEGAAGQTGEDSSLIQAAEAAARLARCVFILHDAVCPHYQEQQVSSAQTVQQQQQGQHQELVACDVDHRSKTQRLDSSEHHPQLQHSQHAPQAAPAKDNSSSMSQLAEGADLDVLPRWYI